MPTDHAGSVVHVRIEVRDRILNHARTHPTRECCGALLGHSHGERLIEVAVPVANEARDPTREYLIPAEGMRAIERHARRRGLEVVGLFHSHPYGPAVPSAADLEAAWPWFTYLIAPLGSAQGAGCAETAGCAGPAASGPGGADRAGDPTAWRLKHDRSGFVPERIEWTA